MPPIDVKNAPLNTQGLVDQINRLEKDKAVLLEACKEAYDHLISEDYNGDNAHALCQKAISQAERTS